MTDENPYASPAPDVEQTPRFSAGRFVKLVMLVIVTGPITMVACAVAFYFGWEIATMIALSAGISTDDVESWGGLFGFGFAILAAATVAYVMIRIVRNVADGPSRTEQGEPQEPTT